MYVIKRGGSAWLCSSAIEVFENQNVSLRLQGEVKDFEVFKQRLDNFECVDAGVIKVYKCSNSESCKNCEKCVGCKIAQVVQETAQAHKEFARLIEDNGGYLL